MNTRSYGLVAAAGLLALGLILTVMQLNAEPMAEPNMRVAVAAAQIPPYSVVTQDMLGSSVMSVRAARERGAYPVAATAGLMAVGLIAPGELLTGVNAKPVTDVRFVEDMGLEIVSFQASVDRVVGGKVRPGHRVNLYGTGQGEDGEPFTLLIEPRLWVVGVSSGGQPVSFATPMPDLTTGALEYVNNERERPSTLITVAVPPDQAVNIIHEVGSRRLSPYVTLAANGTAVMPATPVPPSWTQAVVSQYPPLVPTPYATLPPTGMGGMAGANDH